MSTLAARILAGYSPTPEEIRSLAGSVLSQDTTKGQASIRLKPVSWISGSRDEEDDGA